MDQIFDLSDVSDLPPEFELRKKRPGPTWGRIIDRLGAGEQIDVDRARAAYYRMFHKLPSRNSVACQLNGYARKEALRRVGSGVYERTTAPC